MRHHASLYLLPLSLVLLVIVSCSKTPRGIPSQEEMARILADVYTGEVVVEYNHSAYPDDSTKMVVKQSVLAAHKLDQEHFDSAMSWYGHHIEEYIKVCDRAVEILEKRVAKIPDDPNGSNQIMVFGDSAQVWPLPAFYHISSNTPSRYIKFNLLPDENWEKGDEYTLSFKSFNSRSSINSTVAVDYADGGTVYTTKAQDGDGRFELKLRLDSTRQASHVYGYIAFDPQNGEHIYLDSVSLIRTRLNPVGYYGVNHQPHLDRGIDSLKSR